MMPSLILIIFLFGFSTQIVNAWPQNLTRQKWVTELFLEARNNFILDEEVDIQCRNDFKLYTSHLANQTVWAVRMLESSDWPTLGLLSGVTTHLGNWAECLEAEGSGVSGQYCLVQAKFNYTFAEEEDNCIELTPDSKKLNDASAWHVMQEFEKNPVYLSRLKLAWALCVPSSCSLRDISKSLEALLVPLFHKNGLNITINVKPELCSISSEFAYSTEFYYMTLLYAILFVAVAITSSYYTFKRRRTCETSNAILECFSLDYNLKKLYQTRVPSEYNLIYMIKVVGIVLVVGGHIVLAETQAAQFQTEDFEKLFYSYECLAALDSCVDVYSVISGFLLLHFNLDAAKKRGWRFVVLKIFSQWAKLSALIGMHILFSIYTLPYTGEGPFWKKMVFSEAERCKENWWMNILAVANFYPPGILCMVHTWYLSVSVQLSIMGGILLYAFSKSEKVGFTASIIIFFCGILRTFFLVYSGAYNSIFLGYMKTLSNLQYENDFVLYISTSPRIGPFVLGFIAAHLIHKLKQQKIVLSTGQITKIFLTSSALAILFAYYRKCFNVPGRQYSYFENAMYASFSRSFLILPFVSFFCIYYGCSVYLAETFFNDLCQHKGWVLLGRLVPDVYLIHLPVLLNGIMSRRTYSPNKNEYDIYWQMAAAVYYCFLNAFIWVLFVESPIANIITLILVKLTSIFQPAEKKKMVKNLKNSKSSKNEDKCE